MSKGWHEEFRRRLLQAPPVAAAPEAADGLELRPAGGVPVTVWDNVSHDRMMAEISANANPAAVTESAQEWLRIGEELQLHERALTRAIEDSRSDWRGPGGDAVRRHLTAVAHWLGTTARGALLTGRQQQVHAQALEEARRRMAANPPVEFSPEAANARLQGITDPAGYARQLAEDTRTRQAQEAAHAEAARIMTEYDRTLAQAVVTPFFAAPPELPGVRGSAGPGAVRESLVVSAAGVPRLDETAAAAANPAGVSPLSRPGSEVTGGPFSRSDAAVSGVPSLPRPDAEAGEARPVSRSDAVVSGIPPLPQPHSEVPGGASPLPQPDSTAASGASPLRQPDSHGVGGVPPLPQPDSAASPSRQPDSHGAGGVPPFPQPDSTAASGASPFRRPDPHGVPPSPHPGPEVAGEPFSRSATTGVPPLPPPDSEAGRGARPFSRSDAHRVPPPDSTAASGARPGPAAASPEPAAAGGTAGPRQPMVPPVGGAAVPGRVPSIGSGGAVVRGGRRRDDAVRSGGPVAPEPTGAAPDEAPGPAGAPLGGVPRAGGKPAEDEEHRVADYLEADPELFAGEQPVVPPTLGDWKKNKNWRKQP